MLIVIFILTINFVLSEKPNIQPLHVKQLVVQFFGGEIRTEDIEIQYMNQFCFQRVYFLYLYFY